MSPDTFPLLPTARSLLLPLAACALLACGRAESRADAPSEAAIQGEYLGRLENGDALGAHVIALGQGRFQAVFYPGGLPGAGWEGGERFALDGRMEGDRAVFAPHEGRKTYMARAPEQFSALREPPERQPDGEASIEGGRMTGRIPAGPFGLERVVRKSPTLGAKPPEGALVLFDGTDAEAWEGGRMDDDGNLIGGARSRRQFQSFRAHIEFMTPLRPAARGQGRANSGVYIQDRYEVQVLDSFGLEGLANECASIYARAAPSVNMCLPPLQWQTFDIDFEAPQFDEDGKKTRNAVLTLDWNGVRVFDGHEIPRVTGGARGREGEPGALYLQAKSRDVLYRNIWVIEKETP